MVKPSTHNQPFFSPQKNPKKNLKKIKRRNETVPIKESGSFLDPESDVETENECDANEDATDPHHIKRDKELADDATIDQLNVTKRESSCVRHSLLFVYSKLEYFNLFSPKNMQMNFLYPQQIRNWTQEDMMKYLFENF